MVESNADEISEQMEEEAMEQENTGEDNDSESDSDDSSDDEETIKAIEELENQVIASKNVRQVCV